MEKRRKTGDDVKDSDSEAIELLVHNIHSIPVCIAARTDNDVTYDRLDQPCSATITGGTKISVSLSHCSSEARPILGF